MRLTVQWQDPSREPHAGQFYMLRAWAADATPILSRPISVDDFDNQTGALTFLYQVKGEGTRKLAALAAGDTLTVTGPCGNGFDTAALASAHKRIAVVGGGNSALEEALYLTNFAKNVTIIHRRDAFRADKTMQERVAQNHKINVIWNCVVEEILGTESPLGVTGLRLKNVKTDNTTEVAVDGVFIAIGHHPNTDLVKGHLHLDKENYIVTKHNSCETSIKGVFAAGDVRDPQYRQAIIAAGSGCIAALEAEKYLNELGEQKNAVKPEAV